MPHITKGSERWRTIVHGLKQSTTATTAAGSTGWIDIKNVLRVLVIGLRVKGTGNITANTGVYVSAAATGTSAAAITTLGATHAMTGMVTAANGTILRPAAGMCVFDISQTQIQNALANGRYISVKARKKTKADRIIWIYQLLMSDEKSGNTPTGANHQTATITAP